MSVNNTACSPSGNCTVLDGAFTNGTYFDAQYDPNYPVPLWRNRLELAFMCVFNSMTLVVINARLWYRYRKIRRFRGDDRWMMAAGFFLMLYFASQIGVNRSGSGLHMQNVPESWRPLHWHYMFGWAGYYIVTSCIKMSVCYCFLHILPTHFKKLRWGVYGLCAVIISLMIAMCMAWWLGCEPFDSNFIWAINSDYCINYDIFRWLWVGLSMAIDLVLVTIPLQILKRAKLRVHERKLLKMIFSATLLGTITLAAGIYGVWGTRVQESDDPFYHEIAFLMMTDIEIFMYALGASFPVLSKYLVQRADPGPSAHHPNNSNFSSWARYIPNFFPDANTNLSGTTGDALFELPSSSTFQKRHDSGTSLTSGGESSKPSRSNSGVLEGGVCFYGEGERERDVERDLEKGRVKTEYKLAVGNEEGGFREYVGREDVVGKGW